MKRCVDLSAAKTATLRFTYRAVSAVAKDKVGVYAASSPTATMTLLQTFSSPTSGSASISLTPYRSSSTCFALQVDGDYGNASKYFAVDDVKVDMALPSTVMSSEVDAFGVFEMPYLVKVRDHRKRIENEIVWSKRARCGRAGEAAG